MNILLTSIGRRAYMADWFRNALAGRGRVHALNSIPTSAFLHADACAIAPPIRSAEYIPFLLEYCRINEIDAIIPFFDIDLPVLAGAAPLFKERGTTVVVASPEVVEICRDKWLSSVRLQEWGISSPATFLSPAAAIKAVNDGVVKFPLIVKPRKGLGSIGVHTAFTPDELEIFFRRALREVDESWLGCECDDMGENRVVVQQRIEGCEYGLEVLNDLNGNLAAVSAKRKIAMRAGETDEAVTVDTAPFTEIARTLSERLRHPGNLDVDCIVTPDGEIFVIDMNARFGGQYPFTHLAGADFPAQIVEWLSGGGNNNEWLTVRSGIHSCKELSPALCP